MVNFLILLKNEAVHILFLAEEYYKNDYPEEENSGRKLCLTITLAPLTSIFEDEFHEGSDYDDMMHYDDARDQDF